MQPLVSIIITTRNSAATLGALLESVKRQSYKNLPAGRQGIEVIVVDNNSKDETRGIARKYTKNVYQKGPERSAQRNFGASKASGEYLLFLDSDMVLGKRVVEECVLKTDPTSPPRSAKARLRGARIGGVVIPERSFGEGFWAKAKTLEREINEGEAFFEGARFFPKEIFWEFGGYDEKLTGPEDWDLPQRVAKKYKIERIKSCILHNEGKPTLLGLARRKFYYGLSAQKYLKKQKLSVVSPTTVYFLRPAFYRNWKKLTRNPLVSLGMFVMLGMELVGGGFGYLVGRLRNA